MALKAATVDVTLATGEKLPVRGYACKVLGIPMVVHRPLFNGGPKLAETGWAVSEPRTGLRVTVCNERRASRQQAIDKATQVANNMGGVQVVRRRIKSSKAAW